LIALGSVIACAQSNESGEETSTGAIKTGEIARKLSSLDPLERQRAAEELARLAAVDQLKLVEGYRLQEKNARVRLALDWALYRMGKSGTLYNIVRDLDSSRRNQADAYLGQLDSPDQLYIFLDRVNTKTRARLLEVLARLGDAETLDHLKPYLESYEPQVADAARFAQREINLRLTHTPPDAATRPRQTGIAPETSP
jgi:HEAT repeat protein